MSAGAPVLTAAFVTAQIASANPMPATLAGVLDAACDRWA